MKKHDICVWVMYFNKFEKPHSFSVPRTFFCGHCRCSPDLLMSTSGDPDGSRRFKVTVSDNKSPSCHTSQHHQIILQQRQVSRFSSLYSLLILLPGVHKLNPLPLWSHQQLTWDVSLCCRESLNLSSDQIRDIMQTVAETTEDTYT